MSAEASIAGGLSTEVSDRIVAIDNEASIRLAADASLSAEFSTEIESLALTDEQTIELNTIDNTIRLKDTVAAPASGIRTFEGEVDVQSVLKVAGVDVMVEISTEISNRIADVDAEESRAMSAEASIATDLSSEISNRIADVDTEESRAISAEASITTDLSSEISNRIADVDAEESRAMSAEASIATDLSSEISNREVAIDAEASFRVEGDQSLQNQIDFITSNIDPVAIDSLTEIVAAFY